MNVIRDVEGPKQGERVMVAVTESRQTGATGRLRLEEKSNSLLREMVSHLSLLRDLVVDLFVGTFSTAVACSTVPRHQMSGGWEAGQKFFHVAIEAMMTRSRKLLSMLQQTLR